jgi:hypothetical protein
MSLIEEHTGLLTSDRQHIGNIYFQPPKCDRDLILSSPPPATAPGGQLTEFTKFPKLPAELRYRIWYFAVEPRKLKLKQGVFNEYEEDRIATFTPNPVTLRVNQESRIETQRQYICVDESFAMSPFYYMPNFDTAIITYGDRRGYGNNAQAFDIGIGLNLSPQVMGKVYEHLKKRDSWTNRSQMARMRGMFAPPTKIHQVEEIN